MKNYLLLFILFFFSQTLSAQFLEVDNGSTSIFNQPTQTHQPQELGNILASTPPSVGDLSGQLQYVLDSLTSELGAVGLSASMILPNGDVWNGASGIHNLNNSPISSDMRLGMGSVSKTLTAAAIMQLVEEDVLTLEDTLGMWLPQYPNIDLGIKIKMLLNHTSGIYNYTNNPLFSTYLNQNLSSFIDMETVLNSWVDIPSFTPGTAWEYSNTNYVLLGLIIESATGNDYHEEIRSRLIAPNTLNSIYLHPQELPTGPVSNLWIDLTGDGVANDYTSAGLSDVGLFSAAWAAGSFMTKAEDLAHWIKYLMNGEVVEQTTLEEMMNTFTVNPNFHYGLGIYNIEVNGNQWWGHDGYIYYQTLAMYSPELDVSFVLMCNDGVFQNMGLIYFALIQAYLDFDPVPISESMGQVNGFDIFPNPAKSELNITVENTGSTASEIKIFNELGQLVFQENYLFPDGLHSIQLDNCDQWPSGMYSFQLVTKKGITARRFVKQ